MQPKISGEAEEILSGWRGDARNVLVRSYLEYILRYSGTDQENIPNVFKNKRTTDSWLSMEPLSYSLFWNSLQRPFIGSHWNCWHFHACGSHMSRQYLDKYLSLILVVSLFNHIIRPSIQELCLDFGYS